MGCGEAGACPQQSMGGRWGTTWMDCQSIAGQHRQDKQPCTHSFTHKGNVERPNNLTVMFLDCGRKPTACTLALGEHANFIQKDPGSRTQDLLAARQQSYQLCHRAAWVKKFCLKILDVQSW
ncbi:hypothetical protein CHARACLAT_021620 [Characodon lateralis]|uniref:Uncharacterized protein n=1 Tax=Characodon lateralis TaxID=208331 RepID=A0ABU7ELP9_9TELE|nr:hypothetical protein [Characodon lateralis]